MNNFNWLNKDSRNFLNNGYLHPDTTPEQRVRDICDNAESILAISGFADKLYDYCSRGWVSFSSPVWANFGLRALPISCFGSACNDTMESILGTNSEIGMMTKQGGGTSLYLGDLRHRGAPISTGGASEGAVHFARLTDSIIDICKQADVRRGACAVYLPMDHPDIEEFLEIKHEGHPIQNLQSGVTIKDSWMEDMIAGDKSKRKLWAKVIKSRVDVGFPYILFVDNANNAAPECYKKYGKVIKASNLCSEIQLSSNGDESFVCCLSSINLLYWDDWRYTDLVETMVFFLDAVMSEFISKARQIPYMDRAVKFAEEQRALGLGVLGYHSMLQKKKIPIESMEAKYINSSVFKTIRTASDAATEKLGRMFGVPLLLEGTGRRNVTTLAVAPTKSSSFILEQVSMGIEPIKSNYFIKDLAKSKTVYKNPILKALLGQKGLDTAETWKSILDKDGSVQHLKGLSDREKDTFKTFMEVSQMELVRQNAARQKFIDQGISFNLSIHPDISAKDINKLYIEAWRLGVKSLYYQFSENSAQAFSRDILSCDACEG